MEKKDMRIYIENYWLSGDSCLLMISDPIEKAVMKSKLSPLRKKFVQKLENEGYSIVYDLSEVDDETIYLTMEPASLLPVDVPAIEYKKAFDAKMAESGGENFHFPVTLGMEEYFDNPFFPAVFKNTSTNGGDDKFLIETSQQLEKIKEFYDKHKDSSEYKDDFSFVVFQQYLESPSDYKTYLRVLVGGNGEPLGASLKYSAKSIVKDSNYSKFENVFLNPNSPYFIDASKMFNYYSGGGNINFPQPRYSDEKRRILAEHNFDKENPELPSEVLDVCKNIMQKCNPELGVLCGFDFMLNKEDGKWYYLENQAFPAIEEWAVKKGVSLPKSHDSKGYIRYLGIELDARYDALNLLVKDKINESENGKVLKKV